MSKTNEKEPQQKEVLPMEGERISALEKEVAELKSALNSISEMVAQKADTIVDGRLVDIHHRQIAYLAEKIPTVNQDSEEWLDTYK